MLPRTPLPTASNAIVIATEKRMPSPLVDDSALEKVSVICPNIGMVYSGMGPDFRVLVAKARKSAQAYWKIYGEYPPTRGLVQEVATVMQEATQSGSVTVFRKDLPPYMLILMCDSAHLQWCPTIRRVPADRRL